MRIQKDFNPNKFIVPDENFHFRFVFSKTPFGLIFQNHFLYPCFTFLIQWPLYYKNSIKNDAINPSFAHDAQTPHLLGDISLRNENISARSPHYLFLYSLNGKNKFRNINGMEFKKPLYSLINKFMSPRTRN